MGSGSSFNDQTNPRVVIQVGAPGSSGTVEITGMLFKTQGPGLSYSMYLWLEFKRMKYSCRSHHRWMECSASLSSLSVSQLLTTPTFYTTSSFSSTSSVPMAWLESREPLDQPTLCSRKHVTNKTSLKIHIGDIDFDRWHPYFYLKRYSRCRCGRRKCKLYLLCNQRCRSRCRCVLVSTECWLSCKYRNTICRQFCQRWVNKIITRNPRQGRVITNSVHQPLLCISLPPILAPRTYDQSLVLHTSGTSGKKKVVPYTLRSLIVGTCAVALSWDLKPSDVNSESVVSGYLHLSPNNDGPLITLSLLIVCLLTRRDPGH